MTRMIKSCTFVPYPSAVLKSGVKMNITELETCWKCDELEDNPILMHLMEEQFGIDTEGITKLYHQREHQLFED